MRKNSNSFKHTELTELILGRKGGKTTIKIIDKLLLRPYNMNQLANILNMDYNTIKYHMKKIHKHEYVLKGNEKYGNLYFPSPKLIKSLNEFEQIKKYLKK